MNETVNGFREEYDFLSNFHISPIEVKYQNNRFVFQTAENVFQAMKIKAFFNKDEQKIVELLRQLESFDNPGKAKYWGRSVKIDVDYWNSISIKAMRKTLELKFSQHSDLKQQLINTGDMKLVEYNYWNDIFWGVNSKTGIGENNLGILLMELRESNRNIA